MQLAERYQISKNANIEKDGEKYLIFCENGYKYTIGLREMEILNFFHEEHTVNEAKNEFEIYNKKRVQKLIEYFITKNILVTRTIKCCWNLSKIDWIFENTILGKVLSHKYIFILSIIFSVCSICYNYRKIGYICWYLRCMNIINILKFIIVIFITDIIHEVGHMIAAKGVHGKLEYIGIKKGKVLLNMYTSISNVENMSKEQKIIFYLGGCVNNFFWGSIMLFLASMPCDTRANYAVFMIVTNYICAVSNLLPFAEADGYKIARLLLKKYEVS